MGFSEKSTWDDGLLFNERFSRSKGRILEFKKGDEVHIRKKKGVVVDTDPKSLYVYLVEVEGSRKWYKIFEVTE